MIEYEPDGATLEEFLSSEDFVRGIRGPVGSGKSTACVVDLLDRSFEQAPDPDGWRRTRWGVVRNTYGELRTTTLKTFEQWVDRRFCDINTSKAPIEARIRCKLEDGSKVDSEWLFIALDREEHVRKLLSLELTGAWLNEARELPKGVLMRVRERVGRYPPVRLGGPTWHGIVMDTNPCDTEHWWYRFAEEETPQGWRFFAQPPGDSAEAENTRWLIPGYYDRLKEGASQDEIRVYVRGEYGFLQEGKRVYPDYQDWLHCGDQDLEPDRELELFIGLDFGWSAAAAFAQRDARRRWSVVDELYSDDLTTQKFAEAVVYKLRTDFRGFRIGGIFGDPSGNAASPHVSEDQPNTHMAICRAAGLPVEAAHSNDLRLRIEAVAKPLRTLVDGRPQLMVSKRCVMLRKGFNGRYRYGKRTISGDEGYTDKPVKNEYSHPHDALQMIMVSAGEADTVLNIERPKAPVVPPGRGYGAWMRRRR